jgi:hypothetical protein
MNNANTAPALLLNTLVLFHAVTVKAGFFGRLGTAVWFARVILLGNPLYVMVSKTGLVQVANQKWAQENLSASRVNGKLVPAMMVSSTLLAFLERDATARNFLRMASYTSPTMEKYHAAELAKIEQRMADRKHYCDICGRPEGDCYGICPNADPYAGDQAREEEDYSFGAQYDRYDGYRADAVDAMGEDRLAPQGA